MIVLKYKKIMLLSHIGVSLYTNLKYILICQKRTQNLRRINQQKRKAPPRRKRIQRKKLDNIKTQRARHLAELFILVPTPYW